MKRGRKPKYNCDEDRRQANKENKTRYMLNTPWTCQTCGYVANLSSKWMHIKTKKHIHNTIIEAVQADERIELIIDDEQI